MSDAPLLRERLRVATRGSDLALTQTRHIAARLERELGVETELVVLRTTGDRICTSCEVKAECLDYALDNDERFGIWGGLSERERRRLRRARSA